MADKRQTTNSGRVRNPRVRKTRDEDPKMIGQWKVGRTIGKGSSGRVKIARHTKTHQYAAIKIVSKNALLHSRMSMSDAPAQAEKVILGIEREIVIMKLIDHPNVLSLYDVWETGNELYLIMEYVEGGELFDYLVSRGRLPANEALHYFQQIISAISYCHGFNIAHRDLKPENLLLSKSSSGRNIKVADFGMAAYTDPAALLSTSCGSPHYASPEVIEGQLYKGSISDIWSCGVILYALLTGRLPFDDENLRILLEKVKMATYTMPVDIPLAAKNLISRMLEKDVTRRITMAEIQSHPFFLASSPTPSHLFEVRNPTLDHISCSIEKPVQCEEDIDADIFDNLRTLWHGAPAQEIIGNLVSDEKTWEKAIYHLLLKYRSRHLENYNMEEEEERESPIQHRDGVIQVTPSPIVDEDSECAERSSVATYEAAESVSQQKSQCVAQDGVDDPAPAYAARPSAPTPQRAGWHVNVGALDDDLDVFASTPRHARTVTSPIAPLPPPMDMGMNISTSTFDHGPSPQPTPPLPVTVAPSIAEVQELPIISLQEAPQMRRKEALALSTHSHSPRALSPSPFPSPNMELPLLDTPNLQDVDESVQRFFHQIVEHLNIMQMRQGYSSTTSSHSATPDPGYNGSLTVSPDWRQSPGDATRAVRERLRPASPLPPLAAPVLSGAEFNPDDSRFEDAEEDTAVRPTITVDSRTSVLGLGISDYHPEFRESHPAPRLSLSSEQHAQPLRSPGRTSSKVTRGGKSLFSSNKRSSADDNKENVSLRKDTIEGERGQIRKKSSLRSNDGKPSEKKHVHIVLPREPAGETILKQRKSVLSTYSAETSPALSDGSSFFLPAESMSKRSWFGNLFNFKPASFNLLSIHDAYATREECTRLLRTLGVAVLLTNSEGYGVLKCRLEEIRDPAGVMAIAKAVRFRVELHAVSHAHSIAGYVTSLTLVQEKGALSSFKLVYNRFRREWELDAPPSSRTPSSVYGPIVSPGPASGRFSEAVYGM